MTTVEFLIVRLEGIAANPRYSSKVRAAARRDAAGYRKAWAAKSARVTA